MIIIVMGLPGTGKTVVSDYLAENLSNIIRVNTDKLYEVMYPDGMRTGTGDFLPERLDHVYAALGGLAYYLPMATRQGVVLFEGSFRYEHQRETIIRAAQKAESNILLLFLKADETVAVKRIDDRHEFEGAPDTSDDYHKIKRQFQMPSKNDERYSYHEIDNSGTKTHLHEQLRTFIRSSRLSG